MTNALPTYKSIFLTVLFLVSYEVKTTELTLKNDLSLINRDEKLKEELYQKTKGQKILSYRDARRVLFGDIYLTKNGNQYNIIDTYCEETFDSSDGVGPNSIPSSGIINCEHTWPQSKFNVRMSRSAQKSDLHHLFPVKSLANSTRGNSPFAEVLGEGLPDCKSSMRGIDIYSQNSAFEPPQSHKGNVARALFYFAVRYKLNIPQHEEIHLRRWHTEDPVDSLESLRHEKIALIQGNRNPFIDDPYLIDRIEDL